jgi:hypothetical protein
MQEHETEYRGYKIKAEHKGKNWFFSVSPTRPELPLMRRYRFQADVRTADEAITQAKRRVDRLLGNLVF